MRGGLREASERACGSPPVANGHPGSAVQIGGQGVSTGCRPHGFPKDSGGFPEVRKGSGTGPERVREGSGRCVILEVILESFGGSFGGHFGGHLGIMM